MVGFTVAASAQINAGAMTGRVDTVNTGTPVVVSQVTGRRRTGADGLLEYETHERVAGADDVACMTSVVITLVIVTSVFNSVFIIPLLPRYLTC